MNDPSAFSMNREGRLAEVLDAYQAALQAGTPPDVEELLARHPDLAGDLRECLASLAFIRGAEVRAGSVAVEGDAQPRGEAAGGMLGDFRTALTTPSVPSGEAAEGMLGDFRILREVGRGGMGVVYEAEQVSLGRRVALKVLPFAATMDPRHLQRFHNEARAAASLDHPHIVKVHAVGCERGVHYFAMKFIEGRSLAELIAAQRQGSVIGGSPPSGGMSDQGADTCRRPADATPPIAAATTQSAPRDAVHYRRVAEWGIQAAEALEHAHGLGIVHRDIKPGNLMIDGAGRLWVTDFGLARTVTDAGLTMSGDLVGTLRYMSPEQALARHGLVDHRTDIYSLGATLYELLTGRPAVEGQDRQLLLRRIADEEPRQPRAWNRAIPADLETIVLKAMAKAPADRYATAQELADDLRRFLEDKSIKARRPTWVQRTWRWARRNRPVVATGAISLLVSLAGAMVVGTWHARDQAIREAETLARSAYLEREVAAAATEAENRRQELHRCLQDDREAAQLQSDPKQWQRLLESAQAAYKRADVLAGGDRGMLSPALGERLGTLASQLEVDEQDRRLALALDRIRLESSMLVSGQERLVPAAPNLARAFRDAGYDLGQDSPDALAARICQSAIRLPLVAALDFWALSVEDPEFRGKLLRMARAADPDPWRDRFRQVEVWRDLKQLHALAAEVDCGRQTPQLLWALERCLSSQGGDATGLIRRALIQHPQDFWLYFALGMTSKNHAEKAGAFRAALAVRPEAAVAHYNLGVIQQAERYADEAIACYQKAIDLQPKQSNAFNNLGLLWEERNKLAEAIACYRKAIDNDPKCVTALVNLGSALQAQDNLPEAVSYYERALEIEPNNGAALNNLGTALRLRHELDEAVVRFQKAIQIDPNHALAWCNLAHVLRQQGKFKQALPAMRRGHELGSRQSGWSYPSGFWVLETERWIALDEKLAALTRGEAVAGSAGEQLALAEFCAAQKGRYATAARFYAGAFAAEPKLAEQLSAAYRYNAACAAARAASGEGKDAAGLDEPQRRRWRTQALEWLTAELAAWTTHFEKNPQSGPSLVKTLRQWQADTDLARIRDEPALVGLPVEE